MLAMSLCLVSICVFSAHVCELWLHAKQIVLPVNSRERARSHRCTDRSSISRKDHARIL